MIYTVTLNPALDYTVKAEAIRLGEVNRTSEERIFCGGKGINVSIMLHNLGQESVALGFVAGFTGEEIERQVRAAGVKADFIHLDRGLSRINVKLKSAEETEINGMGPYIGAIEVQRLMEYIGELKDGDILVLAGGIPSNLPSDIYERIMEKVSDRSIRVVVDATKSLLLNVLKYHPFLIKPNNHELGEIFGVKLEKEEEIEHYARKLKAMGAQNVLISMAGEGAMLIDEDNRMYRALGIKGDVVNSVGAGDSMVAGFIAGFLSSKSYEKALLYGSAAGSATAFSEGLATKEKAEELLALQKILQNNY